MTPLPPCTRHPEQAAQWTCTSCRASLCSRCEPVVWQQAIFCQTCLKNREQRLARTMKWAQRVRQSVRVCLIGCGILLLGIGIRGVDTGCHAWRLKALKAQYHADRPTAPEFHALDLQRNPISLQRLRGRVVLLDFWASWCAPCVSAIPDLRNLAHRLQDDQQPFTVLGINLDTDPDALAKTIRRYKIDWPQIPSTPTADGSLADRYHVRALPTMVLIDKEGRVFDVGRWPMTTLEHLIRFLLAQPSDTASPSTPS